MWSTTNKKRCGKNEDDSVFELYLHLWSSLVSFSFSLPKNSLFLFITQLLKKLLKSVLLLGKPNLLMAKCCFYVRINFIYSLGKQSTPWWVFDLLSGRDGSHRRKGNFSC